jgi:nucleoside-diphosphate-sugar epimerase
MIVVTGATGSVGGPLTEALVTAGEEVTAVARRIAAQDMPARVAFQQADLLEPVVESTLGILGLPLAEEQRVSPGVGQVLGRPARTFAEWAARDIAAFK